MHFLTLHGAVIDLKTKFYNTIHRKSTAAGHVARKAHPEYAGRPSHHTSSLQRQHFYCHSRDMQAVVERDKHLLINREICVTRGLAELRGGNARVMLTNFSNEYKRMSKGTKVDYIEEIP